MWLNRRWLSLLGIAICLIALTADASRPIPSFAAVALKPGDFLLASTTGRAILKVDGASGAVSTLSSSPHLHLLFTLAVGPNGEVYFWDQDYIENSGPSHPAIARLDLISGIPSVITSTDIAGWTALAIDRDGSLVANDSTRVFRVDPGTGRQTTISSGGLLFNAQNLAIDGDGNVLTTSEIRGDSKQHRQIVRIRTSSRAQEVVSSGGLLHFPSTFALGPDGSIFVLEFDGEPNLDFPPHMVLLKIDPRSGVQQTVAQLANFNHGGLIADRSGTLYMPSFFSGVNGFPDQGIVRIDPVSGDERAISQSTSLGQPAGIAIVPGTVPLPCPSTPRPQISVRTSAPGNGRLLVSVHADGNPNAIRNIQLGTLRGNAVMEGQPAISVADASFTLRRTGPGSVTLPFIVTDACGDWSTFVGGGPNAF